MSDRHRRPSLIVFLADDRDGAEVARLIHEQWKRKAKKDQRT